MTAGTLQRAMRLAMDRGEFAELKVFVKLLSCDELSELAHGLSGEELVCLMDALPPIGRRCLFVRLTPPNLARLRDCAWEFFETARSFPGLGVSPNIRRFIEPAPVLALHDLPNWRVLLGPRANTHDGGFVYVTKNNQLLGCLHLLELLDPMPAPRPCPYRIYPEDTMKFVLRFFHRSGLDELPIIDKKKNFLGVVRRQALLRAALASQHSGRFHQPTAPSLFANINTSLVCRWIPCAGVALLTWHFLKKLSGG